MDNPNASNPAMEPSGSAAGAGQLMDDAQQKLDTAREGLAARAQRMRAHWNDLESSALEKAKQAAHSADQTLHAHPYGAMAWAAVAGLLLGVLIARKN